MTVFGPPTADWFTLHPDTTTTGVWIGYTGRISGYVALWDSLGYAGTLRRGDDDYAMFHRVQFRTTDGADLQVGSLNLASRDPYESPQVAAWVRAGEDDRGVWIAGALTLPSLTDLVECGDRWQLHGSRRSTGSGPRLATVIVTLPDEPQGSLW